MPNQVTAAGLETQTQAELVAQFTADFQAIYGADINLDQDSPDGQMMMNFIQVVLDELDLVTTLYNGFDPDLAVGRVLDQRVAINGIQRLAGTYTITPITIVVDQALTLDGLDNSTDPYTVADNAGNNWVLINTQNPAIAGTYVYNFQSQVPGAVLTTPNTITVPVTIVLGVVSVNNPTTYTTLGITEETDAQLRVRRQKSVSLSSQGYLAGLLAALENINGVTSAFVYENTTGTTDGNGVPGHSIWVIVAGGTAASIAQAIYTKRNAGCGMYGSQTYVITQVDGSPFVVRWDDVSSESLYTRFYAESLNGIDYPDVTSILTALVAHFAPGVGAEVNVNALATLVQSTDSNTLVLGSGFSLAAAGPYANTKNPSTKNKQLTVASARILILYALTSSVVSGGTIQFNAAGGTTAYVFSVLSGSGSINSATGLYTAGAAGTDVVKVADANGIFATATVTVT